MRNTINLSGVRAWAPVPHPIPLDQVQFEPLEVHADATWSGMQIICKFVQGDKAWAVAASEGLVQYPTIGNGLEAGTVEVWCVGYPSDPGSPVVAAANPITIPISPACGVDGDRPVPPTPDLYQALVATVDAYAAGIVRTVSVDNGIATAKNAVGMTLFTFPVGGGGTGDNTTYQFSISGNVITVTDSDGGTQTITVPQGLTEQAVRDIVTGYGYSTFNGDYNSLVNKPSIPDVPSWALTQQKPKVTDWENDAGYLTEHQDISGKQDKITDLPDIRSGASAGATALQPGDVPAWAKQPNKPEYTAEEVGALPKGTKIPPDFTSDVNKLKEDLTRKLTEPAGAQVGQFFRVASIDEDGDYVLEAVDAPSGGVTDVIAVNNSLVKDGVATIPIVKASSAESYPGLVSLNWNTRDGGLYIDNHILKLVRPSENLIKERFFNDKIAITTTTYDFAVKCAMCDGKGAAWTAAEQAAAQERIGILSSEEVLF